MTGPTGMLFNYADSGDHKRRGATPALFWLSRRYGQPFWAAREEAYLAEHPKGADPMHVAWYPGEARVENWPPLDLRFRGPVDLAVFRGSWTDPDTLWAAIKGGHNRVNHGHLDLGSFELDALGVRWVRDLGSDNYNLPGYWDGGRQNGQRWSYCRLSSLSHNTVILDGTNQRVTAKASVVSFATGAHPSVVFELSSTYPRRASRIWRGLRMIDRRAVLVLPRRGRAVVALPAHRVVAVLCGPVELQAGRAHVDVKAPGVAVAAAKAERAGDGARARGERKRLAARNDLAVAVVFPRITPAAAELFEQDAGALERAAAVVAGDHDAPGRDGERIAVVTRGRRGQEGGVARGELLAPADHEGRTVRGTVLQRQATARHVEKIALQFGGGEMRRSRTGVPRLDMPRAPALHHNGNAGDLRAGGKAQQAGHAEENPRLPEKRHVPAPV